MGDEVPAQGCRLVLVSITGCLCQTTSLGRSGVEEGAAHPPLLFNAPGRDGKFRGAKVAVTAAYNKGARRESVSQRSRRQI